MVGVKDSSVLTDTVLGTYSETQSYKQQWSTYKKHIITLQGIAEELIPRNPK